MKSSATRSSTRGQYRTIENSELSISVDSMGRIISLSNRRTGSELIDFPQAAEAWRLVIPTGRHTVELVCGSQQKPAHIAISKESGVQSLVIGYEQLLVGGRVEPIKARFILSLADASDEIVAQAEIENRGQQPVDEVEFPILGGFGGFKATRGRRRLDLVMANDTGRFIPDCLRRGLPDTGRESNHFARRHETAMVSGSIGRRTGDRSGRWVDLSSDREGIYIACCQGVYEAAGERFFLKLEKFPKETPNAPAHHYPSGTPRWLRVSGLHIARIQPGAGWRSPEVILMPHKGDWHTAADRYSLRRHESLPAPAPTPRWMERFVGWTEILGKTYLGEVFHDYRQCADDVVRDAKATGIDLVFYYGHTKIGAEGADFDNLPAPDLGGEKGFRDMVERLHANGIRIMLLDHFHRYVNRDVPQFKQLQLERYAVRDREGNMAGGKRWWKETALSCLLLEGPTPFWVDMCPACGPWRDHYLSHITGLVELNVDGVELDLFDPGTCHSGEHGHAIGANMMDAKLDFIREVRAHVKKLNPDFVLFGETMCPEARSVLDGFYPNRYRDEEGRLYRYLFPEITQQAVLVGNYAYDQVNKALTLSIGAETEIWGLRQTTLKGCPELAQYIGEINRLKRKYPDILISGRFRDTVGADVQGGVLYSVIEGPGRSRALVLRNHTDRPRKTTAAFAGQNNGKSYVLWQPFREERAVEAPVALRLKAYEAAVLLDLPSAFVQ